MGESRHLLGILLELEFGLFGLLVSQRCTARVNPSPENDASSATSGYHFSIFFVFTDSVLSWLVSRVQTQWQSTRLPRCLFICTIISSCTKEQRQDIWCNTIAGSLPRGAPVCCVQSDHRTGSVQAAGPNLLLPMAKKPQRRITVVDDQCCRLIYYLVIYYQTTLFALYRITVSKLIK